MRQKDFSADRVISLSDGVFAIAMTLLVLDLKHPSLDASADKSILTTALVEQTPRFISWILSFAILCRLWITHHGLMTAGETRSRGFMTWNFLFLGAVAFIPFPTSLLSEHHDQALSVFIFSATYAIAGVALAGMAVAYRRQIEPAAASRGDIARTVTRAVAVLLATALLSSLLALYRPWLGVLVWVVFLFVSAVGFRLRNAEDARAGDES